MRAAIGNEIFHPYSDFLLHDIGAGDALSASQKDQVLAFLDSL